MHPLKTYPLKIFMNTIGNKLRLTTFGESHGPAIGGIIDGFPAGFKIDFDKIILEMSKRKPGQSNMVTQRKEDDMPEFLSGISPEGVTLGTPIGFIIRNKDTRSADYDNMRDLYRPNHADYTYESRYGIRDHRGGGRASARETANWVLAGALAKQWLESQNLHISACLSGVGHTSFTEELIQRLCSNPDAYKELQVPKDFTEKMENEILKAKKAGDSIGGVVTCLITGLKAGIGNPVFNKLHSELAKTMMGINAAKGFEYGLGFKSAEKLGSDIIDSFIKTDNRIRTSTNYSGGIQGGISNGMPIYFNVAFKPTPTLLKEIMTVTSSGEQTLLKPKGRHDPCVAVRAVPVVEALAALVVADFLV